VELWVVDLDAAAPGTDGLVSAGDRSDAARLAFARDRARLLAGRAAVRAVLAHRLGIAPGSLPLVRRAGGKPEVPGGPPFSFSRSGGIGLLGVGRDRDVGVDLERLREVPEAADLAARHLSAAERTRWLAEGGGDEPFLRAWTRLEASLKAVGAGLGTGGELAAAARGARLQELDLVPGHAAAPALAPGR
jgi:4'-phosphopantetheinyl transferase